MASSDARAEKWVAILGRRDRPTDGVEDYCTFLGRALRRFDVNLEQVRLPWHEQGWIRGLLRVWRESKTWRENWVLLQHTPMAWSRHGFPLGIVAVAKILRRSGVRMAVIFHEPFSQSGPRWIDRVREACQGWVLRKLYRRATKAIFVEPLVAIPWLPSNPSKALFIPIGANIPSRQPEFNGTQNKNGQAKTVAVFCLSDLPNRTRELGDIREAMTFVQKQGVKSRVIFLGRGTENARTEIEKAFCSSSVEAVNLGLQTAEEVSRQLSESDVMLCVRGPLYLRRGSAIAGIACGLPIVAYGGVAEGTLLEEAGIRLVTYGDRRALGQALANVLTDDALRIKLSERTLEAYRRLFAWDMIAGAFYAALPKQDWAVE